MAEAKVLSGAGLRGQIAGQTALCTVGKTGAGLTYRGYDVRDLAAECDFEEVAYLLFYGELPTAAQLADYKKRLKTMRDLPQPLKEVLERIPASAHPMDVMRTGSSVLGTLEPELSFDQQRDVAERLMAAFRPSCVTGTASPMTVCASTAPATKTPWVVISSRCCMTRSRATCTSR